MWKESFVRKVVKSVGGYAFLDNGERKKLVNL